MKKVELLFDYPRLEERLIIERLKGRGMDVALTTGVPRETSALEERVDV
ncbi:MAG: hypothetical protein RMJ30_07100 [Nitrososphaerota archaeon]|nr:hypothetical protein [Nitrososphaerota archaeon]